MEKHLLELARIQLGESIEIYRLQEDVSEYHCPHPEQSYGIVHENVIINPIIGKDDILAGFAGKCSCGALYYRLPV